MEWYHAHNQWIPYSDSAATYHSFWYNQYQANVYCQPHTTHSPNLYLPLYQQGGYSAHGVNYPRTAYMPKVATDYVFFERGIEPFARCHNQRVPIRQSVETQTERSMAPADDTSCCAHQELLAKSLEECHEVQPMDTSPDSLSVPVWSIPLPCSRADPSHFVENTKPLPGDSVESSTKGASKITSMVPNGAQIKRITEEAIVSIPLAKLTRYPKPRKQTGYQYSQPSGSICLPDVLHYPSEPGQHEGGTRSNEEFQTEGMSSSRDGESSCNRDHGSSPVLSKTEEHDYVLVYDTEETTGSEAINVSHTDGVDSAKLIYQTGDPNETPLESFEIASETSLADITTKGGIKCTLQRSQYHDGFLLCFS